MMSGSTEEAVQEQLKLIFLQASNKSMFPEGKLPHQVWPVLLEFIQLLDGVGLMRKPLDPGADLTLLAAREELFQQVFYSVTWIIDPATRHLKSQLPDQPLDEDVDIVKRFVEWLLRSGQDPNVPVKSHTDEWTSALQCALACKLDNVAAILLHHKANPAGLRPKFYSGRFNQGIHLPPLLLAAAAGRRFKAYPLLREIESNESLLDEILSPSPHQYHLRHEDMYLPDLTHTILHEVITTWDEELDSLAVLQYIRKIKGSEWFQAPEQSQEILFHASRGGFLEILDFALENNVDINITNRNGATALHNAVLGTRAPQKTCSYLLKHGAKMDGGDIGISAFHLACSRGDDVDVLRLLHSNGASLDTSIDVTPAAAEYMMITRYPYGVRSKHELLDELRKSPTPLKAAINNDRLEVHELGQFLLQVAPNTIGIENAMLESKNAELLLFAVRSGIWPNLQLCRYEGLLRTTMECCSHYFQHPDLGYCCDKYRGRDDTRTRIVRELLDAGVNVGTGDAVRALRLGDWDLAQQIQERDCSNIAAMPIPYEEEQLSFLEATILWCPRHALEAARTRRYEAGALCAAVLKVCDNGLDPHIIELLLINRLLCDTSPLDTSVEMAAIGIALCRGRMELVQTLQDDIPTQSLACLPELGEGPILTIRDFALWWHESQLGSVSVFTCTSEPHIFECTVKRYGWDTVCLSRVVRAGDYQKIKILMDHKHLRQSPTADFESGQGPLYYNSPLISSIFSGDRKLVQACLELGAPVNGTYNYDVKGTTPLLQALAFGKLDIVDLLLERNADVNQAGRHDKLYASATRQTPLQVACGKGYLEIAKRLIDYGANINDPGDEGCTALRQAAANGRIDILQLLLSEGASVAGKNRRVLDSAISEASKRGHMVAVKLLQAHGEGLDQEDEDAGDIEVAEIREDDIEGYDQFEASIVDMG